MQVMALLRTSLSLVEGPGCSAEPLKTASSAPAYRINVDAFAGVAADSSECLRDQHWGGQNTSAQDMHVATPESDWDADVHGQLASSEDSLLLSSDLAAFSKISIAVPNELSAAVKKAKRDQTSQFR